MQREEILSIDEFVAHADELVESLNVSADKLILTKNGSGIAVIQSWQEYHKLQNALLMLKIIAQAEKEIREGQGREQSLVFSNLNHSLDSRNE